MEQFKVQVEELRQQLVASIELGELHFKKASRVNLKARFDCGVPSSRITHPYTSPGAWATCLHRNRPTDPTWLWPQNNELQGRLLHLKKNAIKRVISQWLHATASSVS